ncbi:hypothetical protein VTO42DRAFT_2045 [Malbranchea cinnamomea]
MYLYKRQAHSLAWVQQVRISHVEDGLIRAQSGVDGNRSLSSAVVPAASGTDGQTSSPTIPDASRSMRHLSTVPLTPPEETIPRVASRPSDSREKEGEAEDDVRQKPQYTLIGQLRAALFNSWINLLLVAVPVGITVNYLHVTPVAVFVVNLVAIIPLAAIMSYTTQEISIRTGDTIAGLLDVSFGNAVEMIVSVLALFKDEVVIVKTSLIGVLTLAIGSLLIPTAFFSLAPGGEGIPQMSRGTSIILFGAYAAFLFFQLKTNKELYLGVVGRARRKQFATTHDGIARGTGQDHQLTPASTADEDDEKPELLLWVALVTLAVSVALVGLCAEAMVNAIDGITEQSSLSETFVGLIILPLFENVAEHATCVSVAVKDKMDLAINVSLGTAIQVSMLVLPLVVIIGWIAGKDEMTLLFDGFQITVAFVSVFLLNFLIQDGRSNWLEGLLLILLYTIIATAAWFYPEKHE